MPDSLGPDDYRGRPVNSRQGQTFVEWPSRGYLVLQVLPEFVGRPWDEVALAFVHSLRPSTLRVVYEGAQADAESWRVTVWLEEDNQTIRRIEQEVEVGLPSGVSCGSALRDALIFGVGSPQVKWWNGPGMIVYSFGEIFKSHNGETIPYPQSNA